MFVPIRISTNGEPTYAAGFDMLASEAKDMRTPLGVIATRLIEGVGEQLVTQGAGTGEPYAELSPEYGEWKEEHVPGLPILVGIRPLHKGTRENPTIPQTYERSGQMWAELIDRQALEVTPTRMAYLPESKIAGFHQSGTDDMPARPPVRLTLTELHEWDRVFVSWMNGLIDEVKL